MRVRFTKMQGAGNDFVVLDATRAPLALDNAQMKALADRRFGVGADQILIVEKAPNPEVDFGYRIFNGGSGDEVEHCGNGARCFVRYVRDKGLSDKTTLAVETMNRRLVLRLAPDGGVTVDMGPPDFDPAAVRFDTTWIAPRATEGGLPLWPLELGEGRTVEVALVSMGNPHAVQIVDPMSMPRRSRPRGRRSRSTSASPRASTPASCRSSRAAPSACACTSAAPARPWPAAPAPAPRSPRASASACSTPGSRSRRAAAC